MFAAPADAYVVKKTSRGELVHWEQSEVDYAFDPSVEANVVDSIQATTRSMASWSSTVGAPELHGHLASALESPPKAPGFDEKNGVFFMPNGYAPAGRALAITVLTYDNTSGRILDADIIVNGAYKFEVLPDVHEAAEHKDTRTAPRNADGISHEAESSVESDTVYDLHHVVAHELGHTLGMNDELARKDALMYRYSAPNDATMRAPGPDDIAGLAELYSTKIDGHGNGCGSATVAPKKPSTVATHGAIIATLGLLVFLMLRGKNQRRKRFAFVLATAVAGYALFPRVSKDDGGVACASEPTVGQARAKILSTNTTIENGLFKTTYSLATTVCRAAACPKGATGVAWGGSVGDLRQDVGGQYAPEQGDDVDVSFDALPSMMAKIAAPLARPTSETASVRVLTRATPTR